MPGDTYTSAEVAALIEKLKTANDPKDNVVYSEEEIPALMRSIRMHPRPIPLEEGERVVSSAPQGLPEGSRVVSKPTQVWEPRPASAPQFDIELGEGQMVPQDTSFIGQGHMVPMAGAVDPMLRKRDELFEMRRRERSMPQMEMAPMLLDDFPGPQPASTGGRVYPDDVRTSSALDYLLSRKK